MRGREATGDPRYPLFFSLLLHRTGRRLIIVVVTSRRRDFSRRMTPWSDSPRNPFEFS